MRFRGKSIRRKIVVLLLVPLFSLVSIWAFATAITAHEARQLLGVSAVSGNLGKPAEAVVHALQEERRQTLVHLADPRRSDALAELQRTREATDEAAARIRENAAGRSRNDLNSSARARLDALLEGLGRVGQLRHRIESYTITRSGALDSYNSVIDPGLRFLSALHLVENVELDRHGRAVVGLSQSAEYLSRSDALVAGTLAAGRMTDKERRSLGDRLAERRLAYGLHLADLPGEDRQAHDAFWQSGTGQELETVEESVMEGGTAAVRPDHWEETTTLAMTELRALAAAAGDRYQKEVDPAATAVLLRAGAAGILGLLAVLLSVIVSLRVGRGLVRELRGLARDAREVAEVRLPDVMRRLADGDRVDVETEAPRLSYGRDEVGQVGQALNTLQRAAVGAAVEQSDLRRGVSDVFVNLARRNQVLLHRQLNLLDTMERRTEDADELADLFRIDHLTTRMRRHAEGLVILSGATPARQWRKPVRLMDVVRAAVAEVEDYERIEVRRMPPLAVAGGAVADLTHLIAELLENATLFSPPHTAVQVHGERVPHGFSLEIHDRGLGMAPQAMEDANRKLAESPEFDLSDTDRLGLFVVSRLARRQQVRVSLRASPYGGTTAVALLPNELLSEAADGPQERSPLPDRPAPPALLNGPVDGPVELEAPVNPRHRDDRYETADRHNRDARSEEYPARPAGPEDGEETDRGPLPARRRTPVLVADHGRPVGRAPDPDPGTVPEDHLPGPPSPPTTVAGLPRRVRQARLAPQLKQGPDRTDDTPAPPGGTGPAGGTGPGRGSEPDPEAVRARMASLQRGWQRGRQQTTSLSEPSPPGPTPEETQS
ncbi:nitrate- and nitrite sensing domain-containing protein [Streptomyces sp. ACA25]|uniref:sensor histidine kinase n=1 Tax=Streptomyces sp. ACA25 TaxID=3022596 RepID=UPI00230703C1|nr:nitrate- and nitrite sensing domain-containing protein [Streptomyces sp. ACA25]MDB1089369.1 nitrate- and nitrite sensing domain-containing protein [Streptomyces sp. ACA25]